MLQPEQQKKFVQLRRELISREFSFLNPQQREGVLTTEGPLLLLAGAGSGKTTVLIQRIANLLRYGRGSDAQDVPPYVTEEDLSFLEDYAKTEAPPETDIARAHLLCALHPPMPWQVIAITFTNKAAGELKSRLADRIGSAANDVWAATFHSACVRILRRDIEKLGFPSAFTIYDTDDSIRVMKECLDELNIDQKSFPPRLILKHISRAKDNMQMAEDYQARNEFSIDYVERKVAEVYPVYQKKLWSAGAMDFDDIILHTVCLLQQFPEVREYYQNKFHYVLVDEYQDTNHAQDILVSLLSGKRKNICVVGDDDQSIYHFRGATVENILNFEGKYHAKVIKMETNYRSTKTILDIVNEIIVRNKKRNKKMLKTNHESGTPLQAYCACDAKDEGAYIASQISNLHQDDDYQWGDFAIFYRTKTLSAQIKTSLQERGIPCRVVGEFRFFEYSEIKDILSYFFVIRNPKDDLRLLRVINTPPRGLGEKSLDKLKNVASKTGKSFWEILDDIEHYSDFGKTKSKFQVFVDLINKLKNLSDEISLLELYDVLLRESGYIEMLQIKEDEKICLRLKELRDIIEGYQNNADIPTLDCFLDNITLYSDLDELEEDNRVTLMTVHASKGLEFPVVFVAGMEENIFPSYQAVENYEDGKSDELEEERRLCYVALTRAKEKMFLTFTKKRWLYNRPIYNEPSRFLNEIPKSLMKMEKSTKISTYVNFLPLEENLPAHSISKNYHIPTPMPESLPMFCKGDMVTHETFGRGMILSIQYMGNDALVEIAFDDHGTKRMMLKTAARFMQKEE